MECSRVAVAGAAPRARAPVGAGRHRCGQSPRYSARSTISSLSPLVCAVIIYCNAIGSAGGVCECIFLSAVNGRECPCAGRRDSDACRCRVRSRLHLGTIGAVDKLR
ncbi:unnamed protein product, partial [Brenthis ino]